MALKAPFPWFGGKSRVATEVWDRFGATENYVEPFAGSLAVLLGRPFSLGTETVNDIDCFLANFWRSTSIDPAAVASHADYPINEADLHARHLWLVNRLEFREKMKTDPDFFDPKVAGWWVWGISQWIGSGWCSRPEWMGRGSAAGTRGGIHAKKFATSQQIPSMGGERGVHRKLPSVGGSTKGVHRKIPMLSGNMGVNADRVSRQIPHLSSDSGIHATRNASLFAYFEELKDRLRRVRVCCGNWDRILGPSITERGGVCGVFLDPPYDMEAIGKGASADIYQAYDNDISAAVRAWAIENGNNPLLRIALCGYEGEHQMPDDWECLRWKAVGGYGSQRKDKSNENAGRERVWFSPHCLKLPSLFSGVGLLDNSACAVD